LFSDGKREDVVEAGLAEVVFMAAGAERKQGEGAEAAGAERKQGEGAEAAGVCEVLAVDGAREGTIHRFN
jgi:hypothetical protein